MMLIFAVFCAS